MKLLNSILALLIVFTMQNAFAQKGEPVDAGKSTDPTAAEQEIIQKLKNRALPGFFGISFSNSVPQKEYMENLKTSGPGFGIFGGYRFEPLPISVGAEVNFHFFGSETKYYKHEITGGWGVYDTLSSSNTSIPVTFFARFEPNLFNFIYPYVEGVVGFSMMSASADYTSFYGAKDSKNEFNANWNYGLGVGTMIKLSDFILLPDGITRLLLDVKFRYLKGTETNYYTVKLNNDGSPNFSKFTSPTEQVLFSLGVVFLFGK